MIHFRNLTAAALPCLFALLPACSTGGHAHPALPLMEIGEGEPDVTPSFSRRALMYLPNRVLDLGDVIHFGAEIGPGVGADAMFTDYLRASAMKRWSKGLGYQTLRRSPFKDSEEEYAELGPVKFATDIDGRPWIIDPWDVRVELHLLVVGAHVAVNPVEIGDFLVGLFMFDPRDDDLN